MSTPGFCPIHHNQDADPECPDCYKPAVEPPTVAHCPRCGGWIDWVDSSTVPALRHGYWSHRSPFCR